MSMFQKRHYEFIADVVHRIFPHDARKDVAEIFANAFANENAMFKRTKFIERATHIERRELTK